MDCAGIKKFLSHACCSCGSGSSTTSDEVQITKISKINVSGSESSISPDTNGDKHSQNKKVTSNGKENLAFQTDDVTTKITPAFDDEKVVKEQPRLKPNITYERQVSDVSGISDFALPASDNKGLTELVLEEIEKSFANEDAVRGLEKSFHDSESGKTDVDGATSKPSGVGSESAISVDKATEDTKASESKSSELGPTSENLTELSTTEMEKTSSSHKAVERNKELEWRNKLIQDLDDDEEFISSSDEENEGDEIEKQEAGNSSEDNDKPMDTEYHADSEINENGKYDSALSRENSMQSETIKCGGVPIVIDLGSYEIRAGIAGEYKPSHTFRNVLGKWRPQVGEAYSEAFGEILYGENALLKHNALSLHYPLQDGNVSDWKNMENIIDWTLCQCLQVDIKDHPLLLTEPTLVSKSQREKLLEVVMESLHCPMARFQSQAVLSALAAGSDVALVVNSGHSCTEIVPVYHGHAVHHAVQQVNVGGQHITDYLRRLLLKERGINFSSVSDYLLLDSIKQTYAEIRSDENFPTEAWSKMIHHELPDGGILELGAEIHKCTEPLYKPDLIGDNDGPDLLAAVKQAVKGVDGDMQAEMKSSVLLTGGNCHVKGFRNQLAEKLHSGEKKKSKSSGKKSKSWHVTKCHDLSNSTWIGGSVYADREDFRDLCVTDDMYFEWGSSVIHRVCF